MYKQIFPDMARIYTIMKCAKNDVRSVLSKILSVQARMSSIKGVSKRYIFSNQTMSPETRQRKLVGLWLLGCAGMVYGAVAIGGATRLTESGLSMVNWDLFRSMKPPLNKHEWEEEFNRYKLYPEYKFKSSNEEMTLSQFQFIWTMEYLHRMWGRAIGIAFLVPCAYLWARGLFTVQMKKRMLLASTLLVGQGLIGWWMVKSGLDLSANSNQDVPRVSQYRLATHLSMAFLLYTIFFWNGLSLVLVPHDHSMVEGISKLRGLTHCSKSIMVVTALMGAFVAGLDAGLVYNSWPKYADKWIPENLLSMDPKWRNMFENPSTVQFIHRCLAYVTVISVSATWLVGRRMQLSGRAKMALHSAMCMGYLQVLLGVATLVHYVPVWLGVLHQSGSMVLMSFLFWLANEIRRIPK